MSWQWSPAFDVNLNSDKNHHTLAIDARGPSPDSSLLIATADYYRPQEGCRHRGREVRAAVRGRENRARALGARAVEIVLTQPVIDPERPPRAGIVP